jgi:hypothetical protein
MYVFVHAATWADAVKTKEYGYTRDAVTSSTAGQNIDDSDHDQQAYRHFKDIDFSPDGTPLPAGVSTPVRSVCASPAQACFRNPAEVRLPGFGLGRRSNHRHVFNRLSLETFKSRRALWYGFRYGSLRKPGYYVIIPVGIHRCAQLLFAAGDRCGDPVVDKSPCACKQRDSAPSQDRHFGRQAGHQHRAHPSKVSSRRSGGRQRAPGSAAHLDRNTLSHLCLSVER